MSGWAPPPGPHGGPLPAPGPPRPGEPARIRPGAGWFVFGGILMAVAVIGSIGIMAVSAVNVFSKVDDFERVGVPGQGPVEITSTGSYTIYHEFRGADDVRSPSSVDDLELVSPSGATVPLQRYDGTISYATGNREGVALRSFRAEETGTYQLSSESLTGTLAVGEGLGSGLVAAVVFGIVFGLAFFVAGLVIIIVTAVRRGKSKRAMGPRLPPPGGWGPPPPPPPGPGGWGAPPPGPVAPPQGPLPPAGPQPPAPPP